MARQQDANKVVIGATHQDVKARRGSLAVTDRIDFALLLFCDESFGLHKNQLANYPSTLQVKLKKLCIAFSTEVPVHGAGSHANAGIKDCRHLLCSLAFTHEVLMFLPKGWTKNMADIH